MKKAAVFGLAAFHLLLTTGVFVCLVHCTAEKMLAPHEQMAGMSSSHHGGHAKKSCHGGKGCNCCDQQGSYLVKELVKPTVEPLLYQPEALVSQLPEYAPYFNNHADTRVNLWTNSHAPPGLSGKDYLIRIRTLLI